jgi:hypothetical protein
MLALSRISKVENRQQKRENPPARMSVRRSLRRDSGLFCPGTHDSGECGRP